MLEPTPDCTETQDLVDRARAGDQAAFEQLFALHRPFLRKVVELRMDPRLRARVDPSDVVQDAQLEAFRRLVSFLDRQPMPFRLWLRKTAQERLLKIERQHLATGRRAVGREVSLPEPSSCLLGQQLLASGPTPSERLGKSEIARRVREAVAQLPEADQEILLLRNFEEVSNQEAAFLLDLDPTAASKRYGRALLRLRQVLLEGGFSESQR